MCCVWEAKTDEKKEERRKEEEGNPEDIGDLSIEEYMKGEKSVFYRETTSFYDLEDYVHRDPHPFFLR